MAEETVSLELTKTFKDSLLQDERQRGCYSRKNLLLLYDKILKALMAPLLEISVEEETARRSTYSKLDRWLTCAQKYQSEYERALAPHRILLLKNSGLSNDVYEKSFQVHTLNSEDFIHIMNATFWFAQRHALMLRRPEQITAQRYFTYIHNELKYLESNNPEIDYFRKNLPSESLVYILAKRVEDYVWTETQLNFTDRLCFEITNPEEANLPHFKEVRDEITALYESLDCMDRKKGTQISSKLNQETRLMEEDYKKGLAAGDFSVTGQRVNSRSSTGISKHGAEHNSLRGPLKEQKDSPVAEKEGIRGLKITILKSDCSIKSPKAIKVTTESPPQKAERHLQMSPKVSSPKSLQFLAAGSPKSNKSNRRFYFGITSKNELEEEFEVNIDELVDRANEEERNTGAYSQELAVEIYEYICMLSMQCLGAILPKEKEQKKAAFDDIEKWIGLDNYYFKVRTDEIKKQEEITLKNNRLSKALYNEAMGSLTGNEAGVDLVHFIFWSCFFEYTEKNSWDAGGKKTKINIPAGEFVDFYVWRENAAKNKEEVKLFKSRFEKERLAYAIRERLKTHVEQHRKRPYEQYATLIWKNPTYVIKSTGSHKKRFEETMTKIFSAGNQGTSNKNQYLSKNGTYNRKPCCSIF